MNHTLTTTLQDRYYTFLQQESIRRGATKKAIIEDALALYKKHKLAEEIRI